MKGLICGQPLRSPESTEILIHTEYRIYSNFNTCTLCSSRITLTLLRIPWTYPLLNGSWTQVGIIETISFVDL